MGITLHISEVKNLYLGAADFAFADLSFKLLCGICLIYLQLDSAMSFMNFTWTLKWTLASPEHQGYIKTLFMPVDVARGHFLLGYLESKYLKMSSHQILMYIRETIKKAS